MDAHGGTQSLCHHLCACARTAGLLLAVVLFALFSGRLSCTGDELGHERSRRARISFGFATWFQRVLEVLTLRACVEGIFSTPNV